MRGFLTHKQPLWQSILVSTLAIVLVATLALTLPSRTVPASAGLTDEGMALYIAQNSGILEEAAGSAEDAAINQVSITHQEGDEIWVEISGTSRLFFDLENTDMPSWMSTIKLDKQSQRIKFYWYIRDTITDEEKEQVRKILEANSETKELLGAGAEIVYEGSYSYTGVHAMTELAWDEASGEETIVQSLKKVGVDLNLGEEESYGVILDLYNEEIIDFGKQGFGLLSPEEIEAAKAALRSDVEANAMLDAGASITSIGGGGLYCSRGPKDGEPGYEWGWYTVVLDMDGEMYYARVKLIQYKDDFIWRGEFLWMEKYGTTEYYDHDARDHFDFFYEQFKDIEPEDKGFEDKMLMLEFHLQDVNISEELRAYMQERIDQLLYPEEAP